MNENEPANQLAAALQLETMSETEREAFLARAGTIVLDAALGRLLSGLDDAAVGDLQEHLESAGEEDVITGLIEKYPIFAEYITEEAAALRGEATRVLSAE